MLISDLEYLDAMPKSLNLLGGAQGDIFSLKLDKGVISLKFGDQELFTTTLADVPTGFSVLLEGAPNLQSIYKLESTNGVIKSSWFSTDESPHYGVFSFTSSSLGFLPKAVV